MKVYIVEVQRYGERHVVDVYPTVEAATVAHAVQRSPDGPDERAGGWKILEPVGPPRSWWNGLTYEDCKLISEFDVKLVPTHRYVCTECTALSATPDQLVTHIIGGPCPYQR